jgi:CheY-like chemotaxis protein
VVDDDSDSRTLLIAILTAEGYEVRPADGGKLALASVAVQRH